MMGILFGIVPDSLQKGEGVFVPERGRDVRDRKGRGMLFFLCSGRSIVSVDVV